MGILKKRRKNAKYVKHTFESVWCSRCNSDDSEYRTSSNVVDYICGLCIAREFRRTELKIAAKVESVKEVRASYPRGWHRRKHFVADDGKVYERGKLIKVK